MRYQLQKSVVIGMAIPLFTVVSLMPGTTEAQNLMEFEKRMTEFTLDNGCKFLVLERHQAPVVSFHTYANVGAVDEMKGITGVAHLLEHMAFKGTRTIGTKNYEAEADAMAKMDEIFEAIRAQRWKGDGADTERLEELQERFAWWQAKAQDYIVHDEFRDTIRRAGGVGFGAGTGLDATRYTLSLPSNKIELWMLMESDRFANPVLREFYKERDRVMEERRQRVESSDTGRLWEEFLACAYKAHPYGEPGIGHMSDIETITRAEAGAFLETYYVPCNLTAVIVGDVKAEQVKRLAEGYFGRIRDSVRPAPVETVEPPQLGERRVVVEANSKPHLLVGYHKPAFDHPDTAVFYVLMEMLGTGRASRLHKTLVEENRIAVDIKVLPVGPGRMGYRYPGLFIFSITPAEGHSTQECEEALYAEIERLKTELVSHEELIRAKKRRRAALISLLTDNHEMAGLLALYEVVTGDWRNLLRTPDWIDDVTAEQVQIVCRKYFTRRNRTAGVIETVVEE